MHGAGRRLRACSGTGGQGRGGERHADPHCAAPRQVDQVWREVMAGARAAPGCLALAGSAELLHALRAAVRTLEEVQRGLAAYLDIKRLAFPR
jgi:hypothetical protein